MTDVNICLICYQQAEYIKQCLDGILNQQTAYRFKIVIGDDGSDDGTYEILLDYAQRYPDKMNVLPQSDRSQSPSAIRNYLRTLQTCDARYVAVCDGDDYWTDDRKLQKQLDFLENNAEYAMCFHPVSVWKNGSVQADDITADMPDTTTIETLAERGNFIHTCSCMCRNYLHNFSIPPQAAQSPLGDYFIYMLVARFGKIKCLPDNMAVYRMHENNLWSSLDIQQRRQYTIYTCQLLLQTKLFDSNVNNALTKQIDRLKSQMAKSDGKTEKWWLKWLPGRQNTDF